MPFEFTPEILGNEQAEEIDAVAIAVQAGNGNRHMVDHPKWSTDFTNIVFDQKIKDFEQSSGNISEIETMHKS